MATAKKDARLKKVTLADWRVEGLHHTLDGFINEKGDLLISGCDFGANIEAMWGDSDYEYAWRVPAEWKDTVLLHLLKERFLAEAEWVQHDTLFKEWLDHKDIPTSSWWYV